MIEIWKMKNKEQIKQAAKTWANSFCDTNNKRCEATNKDVNLYLRDAYIAGAKSRQPEIDELVEILRKVKPNLSGVFKHLLLNDIDKILKKYER